MSRGDRAWRALVLGAPLAWLGLMLVLPLLVLLRLSFSFPAAARPPYRPVLDAGAGWEGLGAFLAELGPEIWAGLLTEPLYPAALAGSAGLAGAASLACLALGLPMAYALARAPARRRGILLAVLALPFLTSLLVRLHALRAVLGREGPISRALVALGLLDAPATLLDTASAALLGLVYAYLPFALLPILAALDRVEPELYEAARDLGAGPWATFRRVALPLALPGLLGGGLLVFVGALGEAVVPELLGGPDTFTLGRVVWNAFFADRDWPLASALALALLIVVLVPVLVAGGLAARREARR